MKKTYLENLSENKLRTIITSNIDLKDMIESRYIDYNMDYIEEILNMLGGKYNIGFYQRNSWKGYRTIEQLENIIRATSSFALCNEEELKKVKETIKLLEKLNDMSYDNKQYDNLKTKVDNLFEEVDNIVLNNLNELTNDKYIDNDLLYDCLLDTLEMEEKTYYILNDDLDVVYRNTIEELS